MKCRHLVAVGGAAVFIAALAGCASETGVGAGTSAAATETAPPLRVVVDNQVLPVENEVACVDAAGVVFVNLGSDNDAIAARLTSGDSPTLESLALGVIDGRTLMYNESRGGTPPTVTKTGMAYRIVGTTSSTFAGSSESAKPFELEFTCPQRR